MKIMTRKKFVFIALAILACAIIVVGWFAPLQRTSGVRIGISVGSSQGAAENNTELEIIKINGTFWNYGDLTAKNLTATLIINDTAHNKILRKAVKKRIDLSPNERQVVEFYSEYSRKRTIPKTEVDIKIQFDWMENEQLKTILMPVVIPSPANY